MNFVEHQKRLGQLEQRWYLLRSRVELLAALNMAVPWLPEHSDVRTRAVYVSGKIADELVRIAEAIRLIAANTEGEQW